MIVLGRVSKGNTLKLIRYAHAPGGCIPIEKASSPWRGGEKGEAFVAFQTWCSRRKGAVGSGPALAEMQVPFLDGRRALKLQEWF